MRFLRAVVWLTFPLMLGAMWIALNGGLGAHSEIPIIFAFTSAVVAIIPAARPAGIIAVLLWVILAVGAIASAKYVGPLGFAALSALTIAVAAAYSGRWAQWLLYPVAFIEALWVASLARQTLYEIATVGHPTPNIDGCSTALMPAIFGVLLVFSGVASGLLTVLLPQLRNAVQYATPPTNPLDTRSGRIWLGAGVAVGAAFGFLVWHDWQINEPCL